MFVTKLVSFADKVTQLSKQLDDAKAQTDCCAVFWPLLRKLCMLGLDVACVTVGILLPISIAGVAFMSGRLVLQEGQKKLRN